jgi:uncharacterized protein YwgA
MIGGTVMRQSDKQPLRIENSLDILLVLLYAPSRSGETGEPIDGITRLQKLMFLLQQGLGPKKLVKMANQGLKFTPYKMGPYAESLQGDIDELLSVGLVRTERLRYLIMDDGDAEEHEIELDEGGKKRKVVESLKYRLTDNGMKAGKELWENIDEKSREELAKFKSFFGSLSLRQLLIYVYEKYPKMTGESEIRRELGL